MAKLHRYAQSADQSGFYLKGWTPDNGHTTLQVSRPCKELFEWLGFSVGQQLPHDLLYGLLDVGLLYTGERTAQHDSVPADFEMASDIQNTLSKDQYNRLVGFAQSYEGDAPQSIAKLLDRLDVHMEVDDRFVPEDKGGNKTPTESRDVDHGEFESIIQTIYEKEGDNLETARLEAPLSELDVPSFPQAKGAMKAADSYPHRITDAKFTESRLEYATYLPPLGSGKRARCAFSITVDKTDVVVVDVASAVDDEQNPVEYNEPCIQHRLVIAEDDFNWGSASPYDHKPSGWKERAELLANQTQALKQICAGLDKHPRLQSGGVVDAVLQGGYLETGMTFSNRIWDDNELLGELLRSNSSPGEMGGADVPEDRVIGEVDFFNDTAGYGFIDTDAHEEDIFYHMEDVGGPDITEGQRVSFQIKEADKGPRATEMERL